MSYKQAQAEEEDEVEVFLEDDNEELDIAEKERRERELEAKNFHKWMIPEYLPKGVRRVMRFYFLWIVLILVHWLVFF